MNQKQSILIAILLMVAAFVMAAYLYTHQQTSTQQQLVDDNREALIKAYSPRKGHPDARVTIVEFLDPACETCRQFYPLVNELMGKYRGKVNLVVRYAPLHPGSDQMVKLLHVAKQQGQFWQVLELMFESQPHWASHHNPQPEVFWQILGQYGFDVAKLRAAMNDPELDKVVRQELEDGQRLGATKTPTFFVNGRAMPSFGYQQLVDLVEDEVEENY